MGPRGQTEGVAVGVVDGGPVGAEGRGWDEDAGGGLVKGGEVEGV